MGQAWLTTFGKNATNSVAPGALTRIRLCRTCAHTWRRTHRTEIDDRGDHSVAFTHVAQLSKWACPTAAVNVYMDTV